jgi:hypothetical protein
MASISDFLVSKEILQSFVTLLAAFVALYIYKKQHHDEKQNAAQTIYSEIVSGENKLKGTRERFFAVQYPSLESNKVMLYENWSKYKYLFVRDLTSSEWETIENFYNNCSDYDVAVTLNNSYFHQSTKHIFSSLNQYYYDVIVKFHETKPSKDKLSKASSDNLSNFQARFLQNYDTIDYRPQKPINDARIALVALDSNLSLSSAGQKIKNIARI